MSKLTGRDLFVSIKETAGLPGPNFVIPLGTPPFALLRPLATKKEYLNENDIKCLTDWRNRFVNVFLTEFEANTERTAKWLSDIIYKDNSKIIFMLDNLEGSTFGYMGIGFIDWRNSYCEADSIVRGGDAPKGTMKLALLTLLSWAHNILGLENIGVRVMSDNTALEFYKRVGFEEYKRVPLRRYEERDMIVWKEKEDFNDSKRYLVYMSLNKKSLRNIC